MRNKKRKNRSGMRIVLLGLCTMFLGLALAGCGRTEKSSGSGTGAGSDVRMETEPAHDKAATEGLVIGFSQLGSESAWRLGNTVSMETAAKEHGFNLIVENGMQKQINQIAAIRSFIAYQVDVIVFAPIIENGWANVLQEAKEAGIPVILVDRDIHTEQEGLTACVIGADFYREGVMAAEYLIRKETITGKEFMKIFRAVEKGIKIPENLDDLVIPEEPKALPEPAVTESGEPAEAESVEPAETESGKAAEGDMTASAAEETTADETCEAAAGTGTEDSAPASTPTDPSFVDNSEA